MIDPRYISPLWPELPRSVAQTVLEFAADAPLKFPGRPIFSKVWGSYSHNTALPESDVDFLAVYITPNHLLLGLNPPTDTVDIKSPDIQAHEVGKFCRLLLKGNPGVVEMLFTEKFCWGDAHWRKLKERRRDLLTQQTLNAYLGYCVAQLGKLKNGARLHTKGGDYNTKWAYHLMRLLGDAERIVQGGEPLVWKEGQEQADLMAIRRGERSAESIITEAEQRIEAAHAAKVALPKDVDIAWLNTWLLEVRKYGAK